MSVMTTVAMSIVELRGEDQTVLIQQYEEVVQSMDVKHGDLAISSVASATSEPVIAVVNVCSKSVNWERSLSLWLNSVIDYFGQQFMNYIAGVSQKMEKLEYY